MSFFSKRKLRKLFRNPKLFFYDFFRIRGQQIFGVHLENISDQKNSLDNNHRLTIKVSETPKSAEQQIEIGKMSTKSSPQTQYTQEQIASLAPPKYADFFIKELKRVYSNPYGGLTYPLLDEQIFLQNQHNLKSFWKPFTESFLSQGIRQEQAQPKIRSVQKINMPKKGKIKVAVLSENFHFMKPLYQSGVINQYVDFVEVKFTDISRGFSKQHAKFPLLDHLHAHGQLVARGTNASDIDKVFSAFARYFPDQYLAVQQADIVWSEWWVHPTVWVSRYLPDDTKIISRCHAYEVFTYWPHLIDFSRIDQNIFVADHIKTIAKKSFESFAAIDDFKNHIIRNYVDFSSFTTKKLPNAQFTLGMVQWGDYNKNPLKALHLLEKLVKIDSRFNIKFAGKPFANPVNETERLYKEMFEQAAKRLESHIEFSGFVTDMPAWYQQVGFVVNCSRRESQSVALCEGAASGAIPIVIEWSMLQDFQAARLIYPGYTHNDIDQAVEAVLNHQSDFEVSRMKVSHQFRSEFGLDTTAKQTLDLILKVMN
ncbi:MAG: glycosyltransferase family 4 protein [Moraxella sp.]|nr:glycosyltransferase family 4 protein [Moraxella sp.]